MTKRPLGRTFASTTAILLTLFATGCGKQSAQSTNPAESLPNSMVPLEASAEDYAHPVRDSIQDSFCQGGLNEGKNGETQICCSPSVVEKDFNHLSLPEIEDCESDLKLQNASCSMDTAEGVVAGKLWSCKPSTLDPYYMEIPATHHQPVANQAAVSRVLPTAEPEDEEEDFWRRKKREKTPEMEILKPVNTILSAPPIGDRKPISVIVPEIPTPQYFELTAEAEILGKLPKSAYLKIQKQYVGSKFPACNFFLITALCQAGYCHTEKPFYLAAHFDSYFFRNGWEIVKLETLKQMFRDKERFDVVLQVDPLSKGRPGHVSIPIGLDSKEHIVIAQGNLGTVTNEIKSVSDNFINRWKGGFSIFVKRTKKPSE